MAQGRFQPPGAQPPPAGCAVQDNPETGSSVAPRVSGRAGGNVTAARLGAGVPAPPHRRRLGRRGPIRHAQRPDVELPALPGDERQPLPVRNQHGARAATPSRGTGLLPLASISHTSWRPPRRTT